MTLADPCFRACRQARPFLLALALVALGPLAPPAAAGGPASVGFEASTSQVVEGRRTATAQVRLITVDGGPLGTAGGFTWETRDVTARRDFDYVPIWRTVPLPAGTPSGTTIPVTIELLQDEIDENDEVFEIELTAFGGVQLGLPSSHFVTIVDEDPPPAVVFSDAFGSEGECTWRTMSFRLELSSPSERGVTVSYTTADGSAVAPADYLPASGTVTFYPGVNFRYVDVSVRDDLASEPEETMRLELTGAAFATLPDPEALGRIEANDATPVPLAKGQLSHGTAFTGSLGPEDGSVGVDEYAYTADPLTSFEILVEGTGRVSPPRVDAFCAAFSPIGPRPVGTGHVVAVRSENALPPPYTIETARVRLRAYDCDVDCTASDVYRIRLRDTTYYADRFVNSATQASVLMLQNPTDEEVLGKVRLWKQTGQQVNLLLWVDVPPRGMTIFNLSPYHTGEGSLTITNDAPYGALAGKVIVIEPSTGFISESPLRPRPY